VDDGFEVGGKKGNEKGRFLPGVRDLPFVREHAQIRKTPGEGIGGRRGDVSSGNQTSTPEGRSVRDELQVKGGVIPNYQKRAVGRSNDKVGRDTSKTSIRGERLVGKMERARKSGSSVR